ncbi:[FeFe] hydrogenase H-cluster maturation GTPase HydF [Youxingia wuxianensis]|uniref:[FeFe] hydrogenase H-cluster maturation GTPase HydF n=1 Tax=Youxingia wuxianensis TaxID=2763678 RepID=A0A926EPP6_9FIRM|nr:[FeFe] hydrogenase H-cluster maturation GTPase HydF [Youxingia wuxianensis]MBC8585137.1 [FeFe] hydrogenase H-cluster maturation GTPase HydF [Youxingia wuxianensis]
MRLDSTPRANRLHIGLFGKRNSGKSSLINAITNQQISLISDVAGTTTDPVYKSMEIHGIGPCVLIDTAGFDDEGSLGRLRVEQTKKALQRTDVAVVVFCDTEFSLEKEWIAELRKRKTPIVAVINKGDILTNIQQIKTAVEKEFSLSPLVVSAKQRIGVEEIISAIIRAIPEDYESDTIAGYLVKPGDVVLLVMPQDIQAPKGRLILPQVQTIRDLLDHQCLVMSVTAEQLEGALAALKKAPELIITDSQVFKTVYEHKPSESLLTSFSVLFANYKGDIREFVKGASAIDTLTQDSHVLISEACTHAPLEEDIGRVKLPKMLRNKVGQCLSIDLVSGPDFPSDLSPYDLIIHCGACMFNRKYVLSRIEQAKNQRVPITNYGVAIAKLTGILEKISY